MKGHSAQQGVVEGLGLQLRGSCVDLPPPWSTFPSGSSHALSAPWASLSFTETTSAVFKPYFYSRKAGFILNGGNLDSDLRQPT